MKNIKCKNCKNLVKRWCDLKADSPDPDIVRDCIGFAQLTNGDKIRAMSDYELADFICNNTRCECCEFGHWTGCLLREWLEEPVGVEHDTD